MLKKSMMLPVLAVIVGAAASAFTVVNNGYPEKTSDPTYYWYTTPYNVAEFQGLATETDQESITGCNKADPNECQKGFTQDQLVNGDPSQGVQASQQNSPADEILKQ
jgi:hypothetical protein